MAETDAGGSGKTDGGESLASWLGINRATLAVLVVTAGLGLSEEIWRNFLAIHLKDSLTGVNQAAQVLGAVKYMGIFAVLVNLLEADRTEKIDRLGEGSLQELHHEKVEEHLQDSFEPVFRGAEPTRVMGDR